MINLPDITLIAVTGKDIEGHKLALSESCKGIEFGAVKLIEKHFDTIDDWNKYIVYNLTDHVDTDFAILIHADGFIINPDQWREEWLGYDYIGAPWPLPSPSDHVTYMDKNGVRRRVGNSVSLRSKRLLNLTKELNLPWQAYNGFTNEDGFICVNNVHIYEEYFMKFAPFDVAKYFAHETPLPELEGIKPFAFHSL